MLAAWKGQSHFFHVKSWSLWLKFGIIYIPLSNIHSFCLCRLLNLEHDHLLNSSSSCVITADLMASMLLILTINWINQKVFVSSTNRASNHYTVETHWWEYMPNHCLFNVLQRQLHFQQHFQPPKQTGVTLLTGSAACCLHNRLRMDRYPHVGGEEDIYCSGPVPYVLWVDCVLVLCVGAPVYDCVYDGLVSPRCRLLKWAELSRGQWSRGLTA